MKVKLTAERPLQEQNALLADLPRDERDRIKDELQQVEMIDQAVLYDWREPIRYACFPITGYVSLLLEMSDGFRAEIGEVGNDGMVGLPLLLGQNENTATAIVQVSGEALRISAAAFKAQLARLPSLQPRLLRFAAAFTARSAQLAACNMHHTLDARLIRCILGLDDRGGGKFLAITHGRLADLLCVHRPSVSVSVSRLQRLGLLRHDTRSISIADRDGLSVHPVSVTRSCAVSGIMAACEALTWWDQPGCRPTP